MRDILAKIMRLVKHYSYDVFLVLCMLAVAFIGYNIGQIRALRKTPIEVDYGASIYRSAKEAGPTATPKPLDTRVVVSKKSKTYKYHYSWCSGAKRINEENKVWYETEDAAQKAGYSLAGNCQ
jgi:hypothetical protein